MAHRESFGDQIRRWRRDKEWTVKELLEEVQRVSGRQLSPAYITRIEQYGEIPSPDVICVLAEVFGRDSNRLLKLAKEAKIKRFGENLDAKYKKAVGMYRTSGRKKKPGG